MFDIGFWELLLIAALGLMVLGPERLPRVARTLGLWAGRARAYVRQLSAELDREMQAEDLRRRLEESQSAIGKATDELKSVFEEQGSETSVAEGSAKAKPSNPT